MCIVTGLGILQSLLSNSAKFTNEGRIELTIAQKTVDGDEFLHFVVADNGIGIAAHHLDSIFDPFEQSVVVYGRTSGIGLGLTIVRSYCERLGGHVYLDSIEGEGTTVEVFLPLEVPVT